MLRTFDRALSVELERSLARLESLVGGDLGKRRKVEKYRADVNAIGARWTKNKAEFTKNADPSKAVVVQNSLGYFLLIKTEHGGLLLP